jgi:SAM-dependent methyltransferase
VRDATGSRCGEPPGCRSLPRDRHHPETLSAEDKGTEGIETTRDDPPKENRFEGIAYLEKFSRLIEPGKTILDAGCGDGLPVDRYLVKQGFALNGIDASAQLIGIARTNVPEAFYEVKDILELGEGEYCVDGVVSLRAMLGVPRKTHRALLKNFASFMPNGGAVLVTLRLDEPGHTGDSAGDNTELLEGAGFTIVLSDTGGAGDTKRQIILARS